VTVPDLAGQTEDEAIATLDQVDLVLDVGDTVTSDTVPSGHIASQDPAPGEQVVPGTSVLIHLSAGPATIDLAKLNLIGSSPDAAEETLTSLGVSVTFGETGPTDVPEGRVAALDPPDRVRPGETVTLLISKGNKVQIPRDIQGGPLQAAITTLEQLGFTVANTYAVPRSVLTSAGIDPEQAGIEDGDVVGIQDNGADFGAWLPPGTSVSLVYYDASLEG
jgi:serine/threonine-protein kinase